MLNSTGYNELYIYDLTTYHIDTTSSINKSESFITADSRDKEIYYLSVHLTYSIYTILGNDRSNQYIHNKLP